MKLQRVRYADLAPRQKENYNFQKLAAVLADYGFNCLRLSDDWEGADFVAVHIDGDTFLKVQLKGRFTLSQKYVGKEICCAFFDGECWYLYHHDTVMETLLSRGAKFAHTDSWLAKGEYHWPRLSADLHRLLEPYSLKTQA